MIFKKTDSPPISSCIKHIIVTSHRISWKKNMLGQQLTCIIKYFKKSCIVCVSNIYRPMAFFPLYALVSRNEVRQQCFSPVITNLTQPAFSDRIQRLKYEHMRPHESEKPVNKLSLVLLICSVLDKKKKRIKEKTKREKEKESEREQTTAASSISHYIEYSV